MIGFSIEQIAYYRRHRARRDAVGVIASGRRAYAVLGRMAELGERSQEFHEQAGVIAAKTGLTGIIVVGDEAVPEPPAQEATP